MDKLRKVLSRDVDYDEDSSTGIFSNLDAQVTLNWTSRIKGFAICFIIGVFLSILGTLSLFFNKGLTTFAVFYTLGNIVSIASTCFLTGPFNQLKKMFATTRLIATLIALTMIVLTIISAVVLEKAGLCLLFIICQSLAMTWYSLSYVPFAREAVKKTVSSCI